MWIGELISLASLLFSSSSKKNGLIRMNVIKPMMALIFSMSCWSRLVLKGFLFMLFMVKSLLLDRFRWR